MRFTHKIFHISYRISLQRIIVDLIDDKAPLVSHSGKIVTIPGRTLGKNKINRNWMKNIYFRSKHLVAYHYKFSSTPILLSLYGGDFDML